MHLHVTVFARWRYRETIKTLIRTLPDGEDKHTQSEIDIGEIVEIGSVIDGFDARLISCWPVSDMIPIHTQKERMLMDFLQ